MIWAKRVVAGLLLVLAALTLTSAPSQADGQHWGAPAEGSHWGGAADGITWG